MLFLIKFIILCPIWDRDSIFFLNSPNFLLFNSKNHQRIHFDEFVTLVLRNVYMELTKSNLQNFCEKISTIFFYTNLSWEFDVFFLFKWFSRQPIHFYSNFQWLWQILQSASRLRFLTVVVNLKEFQEFFEVPEIWNDF